MRKYGLFVLLVFLPLTVHTQGSRQHQRSDYTFKSTQVKDIDGNVSHVKLALYVDGKQIDVYTYELSGPVSEPATETLGTITEDDLNFDGYPDVDVYLGCFGGFANNTIHEALLWDEDSHRFVKAEGYSYIGEPMLNSEKKYIYSVLSEGPESRVTTYYRWQGHKLVAYLNETWAIESDETTDFTGLLNYPCYRFDATLDGRIPVGIVFQCGDDNLLAGYIYYPKARKPAPIMIVGSVTSYDGTDYYSFNEYQPDGIVTGNISLQRKVGDDFSEQMEGEWTNPKTGKSMKMSDVWYSQEMPTWFTQSLLTPENPGNIGHRYSFQQWSIPCESMMGGHISFRAAGKNKVHFEACNVLHNIAEGCSSEGRPAELRGNVFEYRDVNECHYGFRATFFPKFVVLRTITDAATLDCFGAGASFNGVYIKTEK